MYDVTVYNLYSGLAIHIQIQIDSPLFPTPFVQLPLICSVSFTRPHFFKCYFITFMLILPCIYDSFTPAGSN